LRRRDSRAKLAGITLCCAGAALMAFYRGPPVLGWLGAALEPDSLHTELKYANQFSGFDIGGWKLGAFCLIGNCLCVASFINLQVLIASWERNLAVKVLGCIFSYILAVAFAYIFSVHVLNWLFAAGTLTEAVSGTNFGDCLFLFVWCNDHGRCKLLPSP
jgi:hypothetical protein